MKRRRFQRAYESIRPDEETKARMLKNILLSSEIPPAGKDERLMRKKMKPLVISAVICLIAAMTVTAFAAENIVGWFRQYFEKQTNVPLSAEQISFIETNAVDLGQSQTIGGYTVTLESFLTDGNSTYIKIKAYAPEGKSLTHWIFENVTVRRESGEEIDGVSWSWMPLEDEGDGTYLLTLDGYVLDDDPEAQGENAVVLELGYHDETSWRFELIGPVSAGIELITEPIVGDMMIDPRTNEAIAVKVTSAQLRALTLRCECELVEAIDSVDYQFRGAEAVMKDGTTVTLIPGAWGNDITDNTKKWVEFDMTVPLVLEEVDHIRIADGTKIDVP